MGSLTDAFFALDALEQGEREAWALREGCERSRDGVVCVCEMCWEEGDGRKRRRMRWGRWGW